MKTKATIRQLFESLRKTLPYSVEGAILVFTEQIVSRMQLLGVSRTELAQKLASSPAYVTKLLRGGTNFTLESMVKVSDALGCNLRIELVPKASAKDWIELYEEMNPTPMAEPHVWALMKCNQQSGRESKSMFIGPQRPPQLLNPDYEISPSRYSW